MGWGFNGCKVIAGIMVNKLDINSMVSPLLAALKISAMMCLCRQWATRSTLTVGQTAESTSLRSIGLILTHLLANKKWLTDMWAQVYYTFSSWLLLLTFVRTVLGHRLVRQKCEPDHITTPNQCFHKQICLTWVAKTHLRTMCKASRQILFSLLNVGRNDLTGHNGHSHIHSEI